MQPPDERFPSAMSPSGDVIGASAADETSATHDAGAHAHGTVDIDDVENVTVTNDVTDDVIDLATLEADETSEDDIAHNAIEPNVVPGAGAATEISEEHEGEAHAHATRETGAGAATEISATQEGEAHAHATRQIDPRIRARRIAVAREQGRRRLRFVLVMLTIFVVLGTAWLIVQSPMLDVDHIVVTGIPPERVAAVVAASGVHRRDPLLLVPTGTVERRVEAVPGIGSVRVVRELPGTLRISASEQGAALWARVPGGVALIGFDGRVQRIALAVPAHVIELDGLAHVPEPGKKIPLVGVVGVMSQLPPVFAARVGAIGAANAGDVRLYLTAGGEVRLGDLSSVHDKGAVAESVIENQACALAYVDVSSIASPVARPAPGASCK